MSRRLVFHYARPDKKYDGWALVARNDATVGDPQNGPFGVVWHVELQPEAAAFTYQLQRAAAQATDPTGSQDQTIPLELDDTEVLYPSGFTKAKKAYTLAITSPDAELQAIREKVDQVLTDIGTVRGACQSIDGKLVVLDGKTDTIVTAATGMDGRLSVLDGKTDTIMAAATGMDGRLSVLDGKTDSLDVVVVNIRDEVRLLLSGTSVIVTSPQPEAPGDVEQLALQALPVMSDVITALEGARTTFASELHLPSTPQAPLPGDDGGQAVQVIIERLFFAQLAAQAQYDQLGELASDAAARNTQDLVALRAQLISISDRVATELEQVKTLTQSDPADLDLVKTLSDAVSPKLIELRILAAEVSL
jgi:hypothetical protein